MRKPFFTRRRLGWSAAVFAVVLVVALAAAWHWSLGPFRSASGGSGTQNAGRSPTPTPVPVTVASAKQADFPVYLDGLGTVAAFNTVAIKSQVDGQIVNVRVREGQLVHRGDVLVELDSQSFQAALAQATAKKAQDQANLQNAQLTLQRDAPLAKQSVITQQQRDTDAANVAQLTAAVQGDQAAIVSAQTQLGYATISAPITGVAGFLQVTVGNIVHASDQTPIVTITQLQPISVIFAAPEEQLPEIQAGLRGGALKVSALASVDGQHLADGTLSIVNNQVDPATGTIQLKASFENKDNALWPGLSVVTRLEVKTLKGVTEIPEDGVQRGPNGYYAFVVDGANKAQMRDITVGQTGDGFAVIEKGVAPGEKVVIAGQSRLQAGTLVAANEGNGQPSGTNPPGGNNPKVAANQPPGQAGGGGSAP